MPKSKYELVFILTCDEDGFVSMTLERIKEILPRLEEEEEDNGD